MQEISFRTFFMHREHVVFGTGFRNMSDISGKGVAILWFILYICGDKIRRLGTRVPSFVPWPFEKTLIERNLKEIEMMDAAALRLKVDELLEGTDLFVVEVKVSMSNEIEVVVDRDTASLDLDTLADLNRRI